MNAVEPHACYVLWFSENVSIQWSLPWKQSSLSKLNFSLPQVGNIAVYILQPLRILITSSCKQYIFDEAVSQIEEKVGSVNENG